MREVLTGPLSEEREAQLREFVEEASRQSSERERLAQDAEREVDQLKMVEYMQAHVGEEFDGIISSVTQFGLFVQLDNGVEGLIHISALDDDYYVFNDRQMALIGERNRRVFRLGDPVRIEVARASKEELQIDFDLVAHYREGTFVGGKGSEAIVYDEDLAPKERVESERRREDRSSGAPGRGRPSGGHDGRSRRDRTGGHTIEGGFSRDGRGRNAEAPVDMPYDEWDADFPDPREVREQQRAGREERAGRGGRDKERDVTRGRNRDRNHAEDEESTGHVGGYKVWPGRDAQGGGRSRDRRDGGRGYGGRSREAGSNERGADRRGGGRRADGGYASFGVGHSQRTGNGGRPAATGHSDERRDDWQSRDKSTRTANRAAYGRSSSYGAGRGAGRGGSRDRRSDRDDSSSGREEGRSETQEYRGSAAGFGRGGHRGDGEEGRRSAGGYGRTRGRDRADGRTRREGSGANAGSDGGKPRSRHQGGVKFGAKAAARKTGGRGGASGARGGGRRKGH